MISFQRPVAAALLALAGSIGLAAPTWAQTHAPAAGQGFGFAPEFYNREVDRYLDYIARMSPENRAKLMQMQDKLMQMEMDQKSTMMKMDMDIAKMRRDMEMFILNSGYPFQSEGR